MAHFSADAVPVHDMPVTLGSGGAAQPTCGVPRVGHVRLLAPRTAMKTCFPKRQRHQFKRFRQLMPTNQDKDVPETQKEHLAETRGRTWHPRTIMQPHLCAAHQLGHDVLVAMVLVGKGPADPQRCALHRTHARALCDEFDIKVVAAFHAHRRV